MTVEGDFSYSIFRRGTGKYFTYTNTSNTTRLLSTPIFTHHESQSKTLVAQLDNTTTVAADNFLSTTFAGWDSTTGSIAIGDWVQFKICPTGDTAEREVFSGEIVDYKQDINGVLTITAKCFLERAENKNISTTFFKNYRDGKISDVNASNSQRYLDDATDDNMVQPLVYVGFAHTDVEVNLGTGTGVDDIVISNHTDERGQPVAMSFIAEGDCLLSCKMDFRSDALNATEYTFHCGLQLDNGNNEPDGVDIVYDEVVSDGSYNDGLEFVLSTATPTRLYIGKKYWFVVSITPNTGTSYDVFIEASPPDPAISGIILSCLHKSDGTNWSELDDTVLDMSYVYTSYEEIESKDYVVDETANKIYINNNTPITSLGADGTDEYTYSISRGIMYYYYGSRTLEEMADYLIQSNMALNTDTDSDLDETINTYTTRGKSVADCLRELADIEETTGAWDGYRHQVASYQNGANPYVGSKYLKLGKRMKIGDESSRTFAHGSDSATDDHKRIISMNLTTTYKNRPSIVTIIGKDATGVAVCATRHSFAVTTGKASSSNAYSKHETIYDDNITNLSDANKAAIAYLDSYALNTWEGYIVVSGTFPDLMDHSITSETYGSGKIITLNWSPCDINETNANNQFKVTGVVCEGQQTTIYLTNKDLIIDNKIKDAIGKTNLIEGILAPIGLTETKYIYIYDSTSISTTDTLYMGLCKSDGDPITNSKRVLCSEFTDTNRDCRIFQSTFESWNGYTDDESPVMYIRLYDAETAGNQEASYVLYAAGPPVRDERFYKWKTLRVIVDYTCLDGR